MAYRLGSRPPTPCQLFLGHNPTFLTLLHQIGIARSRSADQWDYRRLVIAELLHQFGLTPAEMSDRPRPKKRAPVRAEMNRQRAAAKKATSSPAHHAPSGIAAAFVVDPTVAEAAVAPPT